MKKAAVVVLTVLVLISLSNCKGKSISFKEPVDEVESIEIVSAESSLEFTVLKTLSEKEEKALLNKLQHIEFHKYFGDPPKLRGDSIRITYQSGAYEMICFYTAEYVENGEIQFLWERCNEKEFNELIENFL